MTAVAGHDSTYAHDIAVPGTFVEVAKVMADVNLDRTRNESDISAHKDKVDSYSVSPLQRRGPQTGTMLFISDDPTQDAITGLEKAFNDGIEFQLRTKGPVFVEGVRDDFVNTGKLTSFVQSWPPDAAVGMATYAFRPTGPFRINQTKITNSGLIIITAPINGESFADAANPISFAGSASDLKGVDQTANLVWDSDIDGPSIGTGGSFTFSLSVATHVITAKVVIATVVVGSFDITVTITP